ncbi:MAG: replication restart helicase PriA, partial [Thermotogota bacterium]
YTLDEQNTPHAVKVDLSAAQRKIVEDFFNAYEQGMLKHLLYGITGSGKTEVYFEIMETILSQEKQVLFMLPEISLTPQIIKRIRARFPGKNIGVYHSNLTKTMRRRVFTQAVCSEIDILLGTRSSVWLPLNRLGLIVVDEEHDESFMQSENKPVYDVRKVVAKLANLKKIPFIFGSATPSVETYYEASKRMMKLHTLKFRPKGLRLPEVFNVNLSKTPLINGFLTNEVLKGIENTVKNDAQCMILIGKKGFASYVTCGVCGYTIKCPNCDVSLTYHKGDGDLRCHYCGYSQPFFYQCPSCSNNALVPRGFGSERVEEQLQKLFPDLRIIRIDRDITPNNQELEKAWKIIEQRQVDIVVGTRMISKGLDFPDVQLVVILNADHMLYFPDFRSTERTFSLIHQMAGRAGRARQEAKVILQSYSPDEDPIRFAEQNDYESFFKSEIKKRHQAQYPPFKRIILFESNDINPEKALERLKELKKQLTEQNDHSLYQILGPVEAFIKKLSGKFRYHMLLKTDNDNVIIKEVKDILKENDSYLTNISIIIDPIRTII